MATAVLEFVMFGKEDAIGKFDEEIINGLAAAKTLIESVKDEKSLKLLEDLRTQTVALFESNNKIISSKKSNQPFEQYASQSTV